MNYEELNGNVLYNQDEINLFLKIKNLQNPNYEEIYILSRPMACNEIDLLNKHNKTFDQIRGQNERVLLPKSTHY